MTGEWREVRLGDVVEIYDGPHATPAKAESGPIFLGISSLVQGRIDLSDVEHVSEDDFKKWTRRVTPVPGDVVFSYETRLGEAARIPEGLRCCLGRRMGLLRAKPGRIDDRFLLYAYLGPDFQDTLRRRTVHGSTVDRLPLIDMSDFSLRVPISEKTQRAIAHVLGTLDDKIDLLCRMNQTLEETARTLFKSWFVDFDPVRAKAAGREPSGIDVETAKLFPGEFGSSKFGQVPKAWHYVAVRDVCDGLFDGPHATPPEADDGPVFLGIKNFRKTSLDLCDVKHISEADYLRWSKRVVPASQDIVFTYEATLGFFALIPPGLRCCLGRRTALVRPRKTERDAHFLFHWFIAPPFQEFLRAHRQLGSTVDRIWLKDFPGYPVLQPRPELIARFERFAGPMWAKIHANEAKSATLRSLRDTLLPKLLSGALRIPDVERFLLSEVRS